jgi:hypothetical protein
MTIVASVTATSDRAHEQPAPRSFGRCSLVRTLLARLDARPSFGMGSKNVQGLVPDLWLLGCASVPVPAPLPYLRPFGLRPPRGTGIGNAVTHM